jgi:hypothetical protein
MRQREFIAGLGGVLPLLDGLAADAAEGAVLVFFLITSSARSHQLPRHPKPPAQWETPPCDVKLRPT